MIHNRHQLENSEARLPSSVIIPPTPQVRANAIQQKLHSVLDKLAATKRIKPDPVTYHEMWAPYVDDRCKTNRKSRLENFRSVLNEHQNSAEPRKRHHPSDIAAILMLDEAA